mmetsp:Transcript_2585/g.5236  ORF Transcript_2585/g.5236 Transcript_2585/m.5236 type:complete len:302 (-) Transcript_2585:168-1073(-)
MHSPVATCQSLTVPSREAVSTCSSDGEKEARQSAFSWALSVCLQSCSLTLQRRAVASAEAVSTDSPDGEKRADRTALRWPMNVVMCCPLSAAQRHAVLSQEAVTTNWSSGEKQADRTSSAWPYNVRRHLPVPAHQRRARLPQEAPAMRKPSDENSPVRTCSPSSHNWEPCSTLHILPSPRDDTVSSVLPSGDNAAVRTGPQECSADDSEANASHETLRPLRGVHTRNTASPSETPASANVQWLSKTWDWKTKCMAVPVSPVSRSTTSRRQPTVSVGLSRTAMRMSPLTASRTVIASSLSTS